MAKLSWPDMKRFCELADDTLQNFEARFKESCPQSVTMKDVAIWERSNVKRAGELNLEPLKIDGFDESLYKSLARSCGSECSWAALKMAVIHKSVLDEDLIVKELNSGLDGMFPATSMESLVKDGSTGFNIVDSLKMTCVFQEEIYATLHSNKHAGILQIYTAARYLKRDIEVMSDLQLNEAILYPGDLIKRSTSPLKLLLVKTGDGSHLLPLLPFEMPQYIHQCAAEIYCVVKNRQFATFNCKNCLFSYHFVCVTRNESDQSFDDCGCKELINGRARVKSFCNAKLFQNLLQLYQKEVQQLMKELYDGDTASCRYTKNYKNLFQLNCFLGQFSNECYSVLIDCLCEWLDIVPKSDQHIRGDSFFLNVVITEVLIFLVEKECLVTRLNAERIVDDVFHQAP
eukprot:gene14712-16241_t